MPRPRPTFSLAASPAGETISIRRILFDALRALCDDLDLHEGDVVRCRTEAAATLVIETAHGRTVVIERDWARFIEVDCVSCGPSSTPRTARS